tara:strand:+ start:810 stop:1682 length:873 start_codon:yes stop_codon:yes gene_type:complete
MKILIIGGSGFLGSVLAKNYEKTHKITIGDINPPPTFITKSKFIRCELSDKSSLSNAIKDNDFVYHFAGISDLNKSTQAPRETILSNILGTLNVLEECKKHRVKKIIFSSSIYADSEKGSFYKCSKFAAEKYIEEYYKSFGLKYTILRFGSLYGPYSDNANGLYNIIQSILTKKIFAYNGSLKSTREYIHIYDAVKTCIEILRPKYNNKIINITGSEKIKMIDLKETLSEMLGTKIKSSFNNKDNRHHYDLTPYSINYENISNYKSNEYVDFNLGLKQTIEFIINQNAKY